MSNRQLSRSPRRAVEDYLTNISKAPREEMPGTKQMFCICLLSLLHNEKLIDDSTKNGKVLILIYSTDGDEY